MSKLVSEVKLDIESKSESDENDNDSNEDENDDGEIIDIDKVFNIDEKSEDTKKSSINITLDNKKNSYNKLNDQEVKIDQPKSNNSFKWDEISDIKKIDLQEIANKEITKRLNKDSITKHKENLLNATDRSNNKKNNDLGKIRTNDKKTILSKIVEEFKFGSSNSKVSLYDSLVHDEYIKRYADKKRNNNWEKINNFIIRNDDFKGKKQLKLQGKSEIIRQEVLKKCHGNPNNKELSKSDIRTQVDFINDQINYVNKKDNNLIYLKNSLIEKDNQSCRKTPSISNRSKVLAEKKNKSREADITKRLHSEKLNKEKTHVIINNDTKKNMNKTKSVINLKTTEKKRDLKRTKSHIMTNADRLYNESKEKIVRLQEMERSKSIEFNNIEHNLMSETSKIMILTKFFKDYEASLQRINKDKNCVINLEEFSQILFDIYFILFDPKIVSDENINAKKKNDEVKLINDAWKFLIGGNRDIETVESDHVLVFLTAVLGLYKEDSGQKENKEEIKDIEGNNDVNPNSKISSPKDENKLIRSHSIVKKVMPHLDLNKYSFSKEVAKHLKIYFKYFCERRIDHLMQEKNQYYTSKLKLDLVNKDLVFKPVLSPVSQSAAENYRNRCLKEVESDSNKPPINLKIEDAHLIHRKKKEHEIAKLKNEKEEEMIKSCTFQPNIDKRAKSNVKPNCPNEIAKKLYVDAFSRKNNCDKTVKDFEALNINDRKTFSPKVNSFKSSIFQKNPLQNDEKVKILIEKKERARIERKICDIQKKKGINNLKNFKNIEELLKDEKVPSFKFGLETKRDKETFESRKLLNKNNSTCYKSSSNILLDTANKKSQEPLLYLDVNIDNNKQEKVEIFANDDPILVAENFSRKHNLSDVKRLFLQRLIQDKINDHLYMKR